ncbi:excinuclease ABC subunit UvrC [Candidatus Woesearchaeota archaeon]|nr:excinuclease ABC subunit UvrC [Candidatus Woesearchaeota archaeon]
MASETAIDLSSLPALPGCYLFKDGKDIILYVGKAKHLKKRVSNYFQKKDHDPKTQALVGRIKLIDFIVTKTEDEALILENNLIKKHQPKYNINLKDAKRYAYIKLTAESVPRLILARQKTSKGKFFGPFVSGQIRDEILKTLNNSFQLRTCKTLPKRPCLRYHLGLCTAPCVNKVSKAQYQQQLNKAAMVLRGKTKELSKQLSTEMQSAAATQNYETALLLRNQIAAIDWLQERQNMERDKRFDEDIINYIIDDDQVYLFLFNIKQGILHNKQEFVFPETENFLEQFLMQFYETNKIPKEVILPIKVSDVLQSFFSKTTFTKPERGSKKQLLDLVKTNITAQFFASNEKLAGLQKALNLSQQPAVMECFDISHLSGTSTVASMVQFRNGKPFKDNYRRFKIKLDRNDDFAAMAEVVTRRYKRLKEERQPFPDLIIIDGGAGQLSASLEALKHLDIKIPIIGLAKKHEEIYIPGAEKPLRLSKSNKGLQLLQNIRDEAHRFAITYNRLLRKKSLFK